MPQTKKEIAKGLLGHIKKTKVGMTVANSVKIIQAHLAKKIGIYYM